MEFHDNGTISVDIEGSTYTLKRPNIGQLFDFYDYRVRLAEQAQDQLQGWVAELSELDENTDEFQTLWEKTRDRRFTFRFMVEPFLRKAFEEFGSKPLPENLDNAPSELTDPRLPNLILEFWRDTPLARSRPARG